MDEGKWAGLEPVRRQPLVVAASGFCRHASPSIRTSPVSVKASTAYTTVYFVEPGYQKYVQATEFTALELKNTIRSLLCNSRITYIYSSLLFSPHVVVFRKSKTSSTLDIIIQSTLRTKLAIHTASSNPNHASGYVHIDFRRSRFHASSP